MTRLHVVCLAAMLGLTACVVPELQVRWPAEGDTRTWMPVNLVLEAAPDAQPGTLVALLNGADISAHFAWEMLPSGRLRASADGYWDAAVLVEGANELVVSLTTGAGPQQKIRHFEMSGDPFADAVSDFAPGPGAGFGSELLPDVVLGGPRGDGAFMGGLDVLSLGNGGVLDLEFVDNFVWNGPGPDLAVFENPFLTRALGFSGFPFAEPGRVFVSQGGVAWTELGACQPAAPPYYPGCAGVYPVFANETDPGAPHAALPSTVPIEDLVDLPLVGWQDPAGAGGDLFDLKDSGLGWVRFVRIEDAGPALGQVGTVGMDIDAVAAIHSLPFVDANANGVPDSLEP